MDVDRLFRGLLLQINLLERFRHFPDSCYTLLARFLQVVTKYTFDKKVENKKPGRLKEGVVMSTKVGSKESHPECMHLGCHYKTNNDRDIFCPPPHKRYF